VKKNVRVLETGDWPAEAVPGFDFKKVSGGLLVQNTDLGRITANDLKVVTKKAPTPEQIRDMLFAWTVVKYVKSNAIIFCKDGMTIGVGAGQMSRRDQGCGRGARSRRLSDGVGRLLPVPRRY
jgi:phosphoribosylaminoimidazolecarboxamide formyltransferase/IMP cyclohydrolase